MGNQFAQDLEGPLGPIPFERIVKEHTAFYEEFRATGATWAQMTTLLNEAGVRRKNGTTISPEQLRATFSRAAKKTIFPVSKPKNQSTIRDPSNAAHKPTEPQKREKAINSSNQTTENSLRNKMKQARTFRR